MDAIQQRHLTLSNDINTVPQLNEFIDGVCEEAGIDMATTMSLNLALEEAVVNVMSYRQGRGRYDALCRRASDRWTWHSFDTSDHG